MFLYFFFVQAEDGIRDLVRSRGLGDVYKRQGQGKAKAGSSWLGSPPERLRRTADSVDAGRTYQPVSYTHLTLPTSDLV